MRGIDRALVDEVWRELIAYLPERVQAEADGFLARQPHVAAFTRDAMQPFEAPVPQAALGLCFLLFKVLERSLGQPFPLVAKARIEAAYEATRRWLDEAGGGDARAIAAGLDAPAHPSLATHVLSVFYGGDAAAYDEQVQAGLVLLLATLIEALDLGPVEG